MKREISVQLYSVREQVAADCAGTLEALAAMGFGNVEPAGFPGTTAEGMARVLRDLGLKAPSCHSRLPVGAERNRVLDEAQLLGVRYLFTGCPPRFREDFASADSIRALTELYIEAAENAAPLGISIGYHNHDWDLAVVDGQPGYKHFLAHTPDTILWEADLFWVARAGLDPAAFVKEIGPRGKVLHFKDGHAAEQAAFTEAETEDGRIMVSKSSPFLPAGTGDVDLCAASEAADWASLAVVELDSYVGDMMEAVRKSYEYLTSRGIAAGRR
jgi:sugar phosphate isomerase/epimerase